MKTMKKMYKKPIVEQAEMLCGASVLTGSSVVNNDPLSGGVTDDTAIEGN